MDCCNYPPYYYYGGQGGGYPPYWGGYAGGAGYAGPPPPPPHYAPPPPSPGPAYPHLHHVPPPRDLDYGHAQTHTMPTDYGYVNKERLRRLREREHASERGALEWAEGSYLPPVNDNLRDTPWSYYQQGCNGWQSGGRAGYPVRPVALQGGFPPPPPPPPPLLYPHRDPLRGLAAMQANTLAPEKEPSCAWEQFRGRDIEEERGPTPRPCVQPPPLSPAPRQYRQSKIKEESNPIKERVRKNKSPKSAVREEVLPEPPTPPKPPPDAVPLPAFKQAFGSTEIGRFSEAFTSAGAITEDMVSRAISQGLLGEWKDTSWGETNDEPPWIGRTKQIKCEDTY